MENISRPTWPNTSEGCFNCGHGENEILQSRLSRGTSVALCSKCVDLPIINTQPFNARQQQ